MFNQFYGKLQNKIKSQLVTSVYQKGWISIYKDSFKVNHTSDGGLRINICNNNI